MIRPNIPWPESADSRFLEYDDPWGFTPYVDSSGSELSDSSESGYVQGHWTSSRNPDGVKYWDKIVGRLGGNDMFFKGGTQQFAIYEPVPSSTGDDDPINILVNLDYEQFKGLMFVSPKLVSLFTDWLYGQVVHSGEDDIPGFGEYYLYNHHGRNGEGEEFSTFPEVLGSEFVDYNFENLALLKLDDKLVPDEFDKMLDLIGTLQPTNLATLQDYCTRLFDFIPEDSSDDFQEWLIEGGKVALNAKLLRDFEGKYEDQYAKDMVNDLVGRLVFKFPLLNYFNDYLNKHIKNDFTIGNNKGLEVKPNPDSLNNTMGAIRSYITSKIPASLVIGGYDDKKSDNGRYPGIGTYIQQSNMSLLRRDVQSIMSLANVQAQMIASVQSTPFFKDYATYGDLKEHKDDWDLFQVRSNPEFAALSQYLDSDNNTINIDWNDAK